MRYSRWIGLTVLVLALALVPTGGLVRSAASAQQATDQPMVQHAASAKYDPFPNTPDCVTGPVERGDPASGPSVIPAKFTPDCAVPWHFHTPNETTLTVSWAGRFQATGARPATLRAGEHASIPAKRAHTFSTQRGCMTLLMADGSSDIHHVDAR